MFLHSAASASVCMVVLLTTGTLGAQSKQEIAEQKVIEAIHLMDQGYVDEAIRLIEQAVALDNKPSDYHYELAYAYYLKENYAKALEILTSVLKKNDAKDIYYQLAGNCYDYLGKRNKAIETYQIGLKKFPRSGKLYLELGTMQAMVQAYDKAVYYYEKGVEAEPSFPSNYYRLAQLFLASKDPYWGLIYGELFMNLERNTPRTVELSRWLYQTYTSRITFPNDSTVSVNLANNTIYLSGKELKIPYGLSVYVPLITQAVSQEKEVTLASLNRIRTRFIENYFSKNHHQQYTNVLITYNKKVLDMGYFEAYNYWILGAGNDYEFNEWLKDNESKWETFLEWFRDNPLILDQRNKFLRSNY